MRVIFTPRAECHPEYIAGKASESRADAYVARIVAFCTGLATFPMRGQKPDDPLPDLRTTGFERRVTVVFVVTANAVLIERIFDGGQDFDAAIRSDERPRIGAVPIELKVCLRGSASASFRDFNDHLD